MIVDPPPIYPVAYDGSAEGPVSPFRNIPRRNRIVVGVNGEGRLTRFTVITSARARKNSRWKKKNGNVAT
jgi:hypothetical protein